MCIPIHQQYVCYSRLFTICSVFLSLNFTNLLAMLLEAIYPKTCLGCGMPGIYLCNTCYKRLTYFSEDLCLYCKKPSLHGLTHLRCTETHGITATISLFKYDSLLKKIIAAIKYDLATTVWYDFKLAVRPQHLYKLSFLKKISPNAILIPLPLYAARKRARGFNQAELIANWLHQYTGFPVVNSLIRVRPTRAQARLTSEVKRRMNMLNAFGVRHKDTVKGREVVLVDDVVTSGSTVIEAASVCHENGARAVTVVTLAHG